MVPILTIFLDLSTHWRHRNAFNTKLFPPHIRFFFSTFPVRSHHSTSRSLSFNHHSNLKITHRSFRHAAPPLWNKLPSTLRVPISLVLHHTALLHRQALILDWLLKFFTAFSILVLKHPFPFFLEVFHSIVIYALLRLICRNLATWCFTVTRVGSIGECDRLSYSVGLWVQL